MQQLTRTTFTINRALEFFSPRELHMQIGHPMVLWPIALVKELIDNALDASESEHDYLPTICVAIDHNSVSVSDTGPGLPFEVLQKSLDYMKRVTNKAYYVTPTRGQLGNALKCVWAAPYVASRGKEGRVVVEAHGQRHTINVQLDQIAQQPDITLTTEPGDVKIGTKITMHWPGIASYLINPPSDSFYMPSIYSIAAAYAAFNPTLCITVKDLREGLTGTWERSEEHYEKWMPDRPPSAHWYTHEAFVNLLSATLAADREEGRQRTVREFISSFDGFKGSAKQKVVTDCLGLTGAYLNTFIIGNQINHGKAALLLEALQCEARPIKPATLGGVGRHHLTHFLVKENDCTPESVQYHRAEGVEEGIPYVIEAAFGVRTEAYQEYGATIAVGVNWTPAITPSPIIGWQQWLGEARIDRDDPIALVVHIACPHIHTTDRGKGSVTLPYEMQAALQKGITAITKKWTKEKHRADRQGRLRERQLERMRKSQEKRQVTFTDAATEVITDVYNLVSNDGQYPAMARQLMYNIRPLVLERCDGKFWKNSSSFTQEFLPDYIRDNAEETEDWDVVWDARGHLVEPHTEAQIGLGGLPVRRYLEQWSNVPEETYQLPRAYPTAGPANRYQAVLFLEKEGFNEILQEARLLERYDVGLMSTKGMSNTAARSLVEEYAKAGIPILVAHDFDKSGFAIARTLGTDTRRYTFEHTPRLIDIGLRLEDVQAMQLSSEPVDYGQTDPRPNLQESGATEQEIAFLVRTHNETTGYSGERVELNAMTALQFLNWIEQKFQEHGVTKVIPDSETLAKAYRRAWRVAQLQKIIDTALETLPDGDDIPLPEGLHDMMLARLNPQTGGDDTLPWDLVIADIAEEQTDEA